MSTEAAALRDEIELLTRSLEDARREHAAGELDDAALAAIESRDGARLAEATARLDALGPAQHEAGADDPAPRRRRSKALLAVAGLCVALAAAVLALAAADPFARAAPPPKVTKGDKVAALLLTGELLLGQNHPLRALSAFETALRLDPKSPEALVETAWLRYEFAGLGAHDRAQVALGFSELRRDATLLPNDAGAHLYYGIALLGRHGGLEAAKVQLLRALALPERPDEQNLTAVMLEYVAHHERR